ncbi:MAG: glycosyltransferase [Lachnospiraceae bacterium]|nr:glycosyltransferase [Lachnospiraceae bacterium]
MRILMVCTVPFTITGIPVHIRNYYNELIKKENVSIDIVSELYDEKIVKTLNLDNTNLYELPRKKNPIKYVVVLREILKRERYDIIHIHGNSSTMALELFATFGMRIVKVIHAHNTKCSHVFLNFLLKPVINKISNLKFACSTEAGDWLYGKHKDYFVIGNGVDIKRFAFSKRNRISLRKEYGIPDKKIVIGHIGTFNEQKNQKFLIGVAEGLKKRELDFLFFMIGEGNNTAFMESITEKKLEDYFFVKTAVTEIYKYYSIFDIFVLPSKWEGLGMVAIEAQLSGLTTIVSDFVPREIEISNNVFFISLEQDEWIEEIERATKDINRRSVTNYNKYDIVECANYLTKCYEKGLLNYEN